MPGYTLAALRGIRAMLSRRPTIPATDFNKLKELNYEVVWIRSWIYLANGMKMRMHYYPWKK